MTMELRSWIRNPSRDKELSSFPYQLIWKKYDTEREAMWRSVVDTKYGSLGRGWCSNKVARPCGVRVWKSMRRWEDFSKFVRYEVGDGSMVQL